MKEATVSRRSPNAVSKKDPPLRIELTEREILADLLYPARPESLALGPRTPKRGRDR
jgi:hypothetical protein